MKFTDLKEVGSGVGLLYHLKKWLVLFYVILLLPAIYSMATNAKQGRASDYADTPSILINMSLGNYGKP